mmetsp:Transcript_18575/g.64984  ORF Transcript_18575/g.64984 Transcript_18575/m.64984 type:complete len:234 (+) Transcript_18575:45-746(+)
MHDCTRTPIPTNAGTTAPPTEAVREQQELQGQEETVPMHGARYPLEPKKKVSAHTCDHFASDVVDATQSGHSALAIDSLGLVLDLHGQRLHKRLRCILQFLHLLGDGLLGLHRLLGRLLLGADNGLVHRFDLLLNGLLNLLQQRGLLLMLRGWALRCRACLCRRRLLLHGGRLLLLRLLLHGPLLLQHGARRSRRLRGSRDRLRRLAGLAAHVAEQGEKGKTGRTKRQESPKA